MEKYLDEVDLRILNELRKDCKRPIKEMAKKLNIHPNTLVQRIKKLELEGVIKGYVAKINFEKLGYDVFAWISIKIKKSKWSNTEELKRIIKDPRVVSGYLVAGTQDLIIFVRVKNREELVRFLRELQSKKEIISRTTTQYILMTLKDSEEFGVTTDR